MQRCPITLCALHELSLPVAFASAPDQPYELEALCAWLERSPINPLTGVEADVGELVPLGDSRQQERSVGILRSMDSLVFAGLKEMRKLKGDLKLLGARIEETNKTMHTLMAEKMRIELRVDYLHDRYTEKRSSTSFCSVS